MIAGRSLSLRLLAFGGGLIAIALLAAWLVLGYLFERHLERRFQAELERHGLSLIAELTLTSEGRPQVRTQPLDPRFQRPAGGYYWRASAPAGALSSRSLWDGALDESVQLSTEGWGAGTGRGPFEREVLTVARNIRLESGGPLVLVQVAGDRAPIRQARTLFGFETGVFLIFLWFVLALAAWMQVRLGLAPLEQVRQEVATLRRFPGARLTNHNGPTEIGPLTSAVNELLDARAADLQRARQRAADLAHALKTPLTALRLQIVTLDSDRREELADTLALVTGTVEAELARTLDIGQPSAAIVSSLIDRLWGVIAKTPEGAILAFHNQTPSHLMLPMAEETTLEVFGALLENAARFARSRIIVGGEQDEAGVLVFVEDDGPGIPPHLRDEALLRGRRLDERGGRHGLGLAIASDRVTDSGGRLELKTARYGGLRIEVFWLRQGLGNTNAGSAWRLGLRPMPEV